MTNQIAETSRELRGLEIAKAKESQITRIDHATYQVLSQNGNGEYAVCLSEDEWRCECPDHRFQRREVQAHLGCRVQP